MPHLESSHPQKSIKRRIDDVILRIHQAAERSARVGKDVQLVAVSKTIPVELINTAIDAGISQIGESKVQEMIHKSGQLKPVRRHMLGSLQTNKARKAVELFEMIQSVDRPKLAQVLDRVAGDQGKILSCLIEVKVSHEETKTGIPQSEAASFVESFKSYSHLKLEGLMTIAPFDIPVDQTRIVFKEFKKLFDSQKKFLGDQPILSMGMSDDFEMAIEEGSSMVRIGRAIFGERKY